MHTQTKIGWNRLGSECVFCAQVPTCVLESFFQHLIRIEISWVCVVEVIKIGPTVAK